MKNKILDFLRQQPGFVSGQNISKALGISRTAVWKYINILKAEGYEIESVTRKGYRLLQSPDLLTDPEIRSALPAGLLPGIIRVYDEIDSTNEEAKRQAAAGAPDGSAFIADVQTRGKGRRGRSWSSPGGQDIFFTLLYRPDLPFSCISMVTLVAAISAAVTVRKYAGEDCYIKWPNDIVLHDRKVCGILTEMGADMDRIDYIVIGIGFNLNRMIFDDEIAGMASSIFKETGKKVQRAAFFADFMKDFKVRYDRFVRDRNLAFLREEYNGMLINRNREVKIVRQGSEYIRWARGINEAGELLVEDEQGRTEKVFSGEVSVRGLYGYV